MIFGDEEGTPRDGVLAFLHNNVETNASRKQVKIQGRFGGIEILAVTLENLDHRKSGKVLGTLGR
jgi:hypothetical protein